MQILALDGLHITVEGAEPEVAGGKSAQKLRELVCALVAEPAGVSQSDLCDWLWPDADGDKAAASLKAAVHRLRGWLGNDAVRVQAQVVRLNPAIVECDVWRLETSPSPERVMYGVDLPPVLALRDRLARDR